MRKFFFRPDFFLSHHAVRKNDTNLKFFFIRMGSEHSVLLLHSNRLSVFKLTLSRGNLVSPKKNSLWSILAPFCKQRFKIPKISAKSFEIFKKFF